MDGAAFGRSENGRLVHGGIEGRACSGTPRAEVARGVDMGHANGMSMGDHAGGYLGVGQPDGLIKEWSEVD